VRSLRPSIELLRDERGIALPMALMTLLILSSLVIAFSVLATSEPLIATNQKMVAQARAVAESGLERAIWALNLGTINPLDPDALFTMPAPAPYDGSTAIPILNSSGTQIGVAFVTVTQGPNPNERNVVSVGWVPTNTGSAAKAHQKIQATAQRFLFSGTPPPASLTVKGEINGNGNVNINSLSDTSCGAKDGTWSAGFTTVGGSVSVYGADGNGTANQSTAGTNTDIKQYVPTSSFDQFTFSSADMDSLKAMAKAKGTYYSGAGVKSLDFNASNKLQNGVIFIDTVSGANINKDDPSLTDTDFADVTIHGNSEADASGIFSGIIVVAGSLAISGDFHMHGLVYVVNDLQYTGTGNGQIDGAVISQNVLDTSSTTIDTNTGGNATINYNCGYVKNAGGQMPQGFTVQPGSYKEVSGS
jgi:hypothetical protein